MSANGTGSADEWVEIGLLDAVEVLDHKRIPVNREERAQRAGDVPYYGATGQVGWIDDFLFDEELVLLGEDGVQFFNVSAQKAYVISGKSWVNNHAHVLRPRRDVVDAHFLCHAMNCADYTDLANGTTRLKLTRGAMARMRLRVPSLDVQSALVARARALENVRLSAHAELDAAVALVSAAIRAVQALGDDDRFSAVSLGDLIDRIEAGKSLRAEGRPAADEEWGVIKVSAMTWGVFDPHENKALLQPDAADPRNEIHAGDVLFSRANTTELVGACVRVPDDVRPKLLLSDKSLRLVPAAGVDPGWLHAVLNAPRVRAQISEMATGTSDSMRNVSQAKLREVQVHLPTPPEQLAIVTLITQRLDDLRLAKREIDMASTTSIELGRSIVSAAVRGNLQAERHEDETSHGELAGSYA